MHQIRSFVCSQWTGTDAQTADIVNPSTEEKIGEVLYGNLDTEAALDHARRVGGPALRAMTFAERGQLLLDMSSVIHGAREELFTLAMQNGGNTRKDAKFDVDGAWQTLGYYGNLGLDLGHKRYFVDGEDVALGRNPRLCARHIWTPREGVAAHVNAFNFPAWGFAEKAATTLLAGMPLLVKPATSTCLVAFRIMELLEESGKVPAGAVSMLIGGGRDLGSVLESQDVLAFTGGTSTAQMFRGSASVVKAGARLSVEADSLNAAVAGPDLGDSPDLFNQFVTDVFRDMTQKTGQKCTAIRRIFVPSGLAAEIGEALVEMLETIQTGNPETEGVSMGPVVTRTQLESVEEGIQRLKDGNVELVWRGEAKGDRPGTGGKGFFVEPHLFRGNSSIDPVVHGDEIFGPVSTILPYDGTAEDAIAGLKAGGGSLVASVYSDKRTFVEEVVMGVAPHHGRLYLCSSKVQELGAGPGTVLPMAVHGGPGRAGGGEELGGLRGVKHFMQRTAVQGYRPLLEKDFNGD